MLRFLFSSNTASERDDTKALYARLEELETQANLDDTDRDADVEEVLALLSEECGLSSTSTLYLKLKELLIQLADESDLYSRLHAATEVFSNDLANDAQNRARMARKISLYEDIPHHHQVIHDVLFSVGKALLNALPEGLYDTHIAGNQNFDVALLDVIDQPAQVVTSSINAIIQGDVEHTSLFHNMREALNGNAAYVHEYVRKNALPEDLAKDHDAEQIVHQFLRSTCLEQFFALEVPFVIPQKVRFEHMHIVAGSGHGKTQTLQYLISRDIEEVQKGNLGFAVIDSQGDLINTIIEREIIGEMQDRVLLVDPNDIAYPPALNMFDVGLSHTENVDSVEREKIINGTIDLYAYIFSSLLGAELTQKQGVIFTYLARMMMVIPNANIHTLRELVEDGSQFRQYFVKLDPSSKHFFETQFFSKSFSGTRQQVLTRLWGVLSNSVFERMFSASENKINLFEAMNEGKIVLINTAKDLLKSEGCSIFGRFFIALIAQAALSRSIIAPDKRKPFMVVIDEAHDYFDDRIEDIANQARKYNVGLMLSHQNLDQASAKLRASIMSSTTIKFAGGVSAKDAQVLAQNMQTKSENILAAKKQKKGTQFACYVRNLTPQPMMVKIPFGVLENMPALGAGAKVALLEANRRRVATLPDQEGNYSAEESPQEEALEADNQETPPTSGKGGTEHRLIQQQLYDAATNRGLRATIEKHVGGGKHIDVVIDREGPGIAIEVSVSTSVALELANLKKCIDADYQEVWVVCDETAWIGNFQKVITELQRSELRIKVYNAEEAIGAIKELLIEQENPVDGALLEKVLFTKIPKLEKERREIVLAKIFS